MEFSDYFTLNENKSTIKFGGMYLYVVGGVVLPIHFFLLESSMLNISKCSYVYNGNTYIGFFPTTIFTTKIVRGYKKDIGKTVADYLGCTEINSFSKAVQYESIRKKDADYLVNWVATTTSQDRNKKVWSYIKGLEWQVGDLFNANERSRANAQIERELVHLVRKVGTWDGSRSSDVYIQALTQ